jgi:small GTP-binding protein
MSDDNVLKIVILGEGRVGKTSILSKYFNKKFNQGEKSTINPSFYEKKVKYQGKEIQLKFWDTAGQEQFNAISTMYYQGAVGALLVYDVSIFETFNKVKSWVSTLQEAVGKDIIFVIAGNKYDLVGKMDEHMPEIDSYCSQEKCKHFFTSAKTGYGLDNAFSTLIQSVLDKVKPTGVASGRKGKKLKVEEAKEDKQKKKGFC